MATKRKAALSDEQFQTIARALADPRRFAILQQIASAPTLSCSELEAHQVISAPTISHHLKELCDAGLIHMERTGRTANLTFLRPVYESYCKRLAAL